MGRSYYFFPYILVVDWLFYYGLIVMIFCKQSIKILENLSHINSSIYFDWDGEVTSFHPNRVAMATAPLPEKYDLPWALFDVPHFLKTLKYLNDETLEVETKKDHLILKNNKTRTIYRFIEKSMITSPPRKHIEIKNKFCSVIVDPFEDLVNLFSVASWFRNSHLLFEIQNETLLITTATNDTSAHNKHSIEIPILERFDSPVLKQTFKLELFNLLPDIYTIDLAEKVIQLTGKQFGVKYWIVAEKE